MKFTRTQNLAGDTQYRAEGVSFRYTIQRDGKDWHLVIRKLEEVAGIRVAVLGLPRWETWADTLTLCKSIATEFEALEGVDTGYMNRETLAVQRAYAADPVMVAAKANTTEGENIMSDTANHAAIVEEVKANIERAASLVEAENVDGLEDLSVETETLISRLPSRGRLEIEGQDPITFAALKKSLREDWRAASQAKPKPEPKPASAAAEVVVAKDYTAYEGVSELVTMGADKVAEGVRMHIRTSTTAKEIASIILDMWRRIPNKEGHPDLTGTSDAAKKASSALYKAAGEALAGEDGYDVEQAVKKLIRSVQTQRTDVRAQYLRSLDEDTKDAAEERSHFAKLLEGKPEDLPASEFLAQAYGVSLKGEIEKARERYQAKAALESSEAKSEGGASEGEGEGEGSGEGAAAETPDERVRAVVSKLKADIRRARPEDFESASEDTKESVRTELETLYKALKDMITATL